MQKNNNFKKPTLKELLKQAEMFWSKAGHLTMFPSKDSYLAYIRDFYETKVKPMSQQVYNNMVAEQQRDVIKRLTTMEKYIKQRLENQKPK